MIPRRELIMALGAEDWRDTRFKNELAKYTNIGMSDVRDMIDHGVKGPLEALVAWLLNLKKYIPEGFTPVLRKIVYRARPDLPIQLSLDMFCPSAMRGEGHYKHPRFWKKADVEKLKLLYLEKTPLLEIADIMGKSYAAVESKIKNTKGAW